MKIHNVRLGHATNSSSSHSIIFLPDVKDDGPRESSHFGWENFTLSSAHSKAEYLAAQVFAALCGIVGNEDAAGALTKHLLGTWPKSDGDDDWWHVDHQSQWYLPRSWDGKYINEEFLRDLSAYIAQDGLVILGGNDNDGSHPLGDEAFELPLAGYKCYGNLVARKDGSVWGLYNRTNGAKVRLDFGERSTVYSGEVRRSRWPELVDVKVTDHCDRGCQYCYQGSTPDGKHAPLEKLESLAGLLGDNHVFEVAIGGGEPMTHPDILRILKAFRRNGVVPNLTTRDHTWLRDDKKREAIFGLVGAVGFSVENRGAVRDVLTALRYHGVQHSRYAIQCVEGVADLNGIAEQVLGAYATMVLLGYKETGRGRVWKYRETPDIPDFIKRARDMKVRLSVDTVIAKKYQAALDEMGIARELYATEDGVTSAYVDTTAGGRGEVRIGRSSYEPETLGGADDVYRLGREGWPWR